MYALMAKCEELSSSMAPIYKLREQMYLLLLSWQCYPSVLRYLVGQELVHPRQLVLSPEAHLKAASKLHSPLPFIITQSER